MQSPRPRWAVQKLDEEPAIVTIVTEYTVLAQAPHNKQGEAGPF